MAGWVAAAGLISGGLGACSGSTATLPPPSRSTTTQASRTTDPTPPLYRSACDHQVARGEATAVRSSLITEASGVVASRRRAGWFWVHNDSGDVPRIFGVGPDGQVQVVPISGARALDWEDIAPDHTAAGDGLWLADIGDNFANRPNVVLYRVPEPASTAASVGATSLTLTYPDGPHNAEALLRDPATGMLVIVTKEPGTARIYTFSPASVGGGRGRLSAAGGFPVGVAPEALVTAADVSPDRTTIAVRTYAKVWLYRLWPGQSIPDALRGDPCDGPHASEGQGEAVGFLASGRGYATISEGARPQISRFDQILP